MKRVIALAVLALLAALWCLPAAAETVDKSVKVHDLAGLFTQEQRDDLNRRALELGDQYGLDIVIVTVTDTGGKDNVAFADDFYDDNGFGYGDDDSGMLLLFDMVGNGGYTIITSGEGIRRFPQEKLEDIYDRMYDDAKAGDFAGSAGVFLDRARAVLNPYPMYILISLGVGFGLALVVMLALIGVHNKNMKAPEARQYLDRPLRLAHSVDRFHSTHTTRVRRAENTGGGGGGGGGTHTTSSGHTHGGGGGRRL